MGSLYNPDYLFTLCKRYGLVPSKKYGQNYLLDETVIDVMLEAAEVDKEHTVVEVGPGFGVLTIPLASRAKRVVSFEIEKKLAEYWKETVRKHTIKNLEIIWGNVLRSFNDEVVGGESYKVVANLPYQITSAVIRLFLETEHPPKLLVTMVQKEVAERIVAKPGDMSLLALSVQYYAEAELVATVPRDAFWPAPAVDSAVICLRPHSAVPDPAFTKIFFMLAKAGFAQKRKVLFNNLLPTIGKQFKQQLTDWFAELGLLSTVRAQELSLEQWKRMTQLYSENVLKNSKRSK